MQNMQKGEKNDIFNYRNINDIHDRINFSNKIRNKGLGDIPIVININDLKEKLNDKILSKKKLNDKEKLRNSQDYTDIEIIINMDCSVTDLIDKINTEYLNKNVNLLLKLENGIILDKSANLGDIYKKYRNQDKILYIIVSISKLSQLFHYICSYIW